MKVSSCCQLYVPFQSYILRLRISLARVIVRGSFYHTQLALNSLVHIDVLREKQKTKTNNHVTLKKSFSRIRQRTRLNLCNEQTRD